MKPLRIVLIDGDTVGPELIRQVQKILSVFSSSGHLDCQIDFGEAGVSALKKYGTALPEPTIQMITQANAVILGNIGDRQFTSPVSERPEHALLHMRKLYHVSTNIRPVFVKRGLDHFSPLKASFLKHGFDIYLVRDIQGGMLAGPRSYNDSTSDIEASDLEYYKESIIRSSARYAFEAASCRRKHVTSLDKANVLASSILWRNTVTQFSAHYPDILLTHQYIDSAAMDVIRDSGAFDVILTSNVFGDILADELAQLSGTPNLFGSAELTPDGRGIYTPNQLHHPREDYAGKQMVSPIGILNSVSMMLQFSLHRPDLVRLLNQAIERTFEKKLTTAEYPFPGFQVVGTDELGDAVAGYLKEFL